MTFLIPWRFSVITSVWASSVSSDRVIVMDDIALSKAGSINFLKIHAIAH
ncbi:hypothetical protein KBT16_10340 [Nostoc sp. CCCryo 231-06]|nr:hypothetical protein [Nostoc sp. CCCryo 231-06]